jgi:putative hemolysin
MDNVLGVVDVKDLWAGAVAGSPFDIGAVLRQPLFVPAGVSALRLLRMFRESGIHTALVVDEHGGVDGLVTLNDVLEEVSGSMGLGREHEITQRADGSWLVDGLVSMDDFVAALDLDRDQFEASRDYHTVGGFVLAELGHIPVAGETFDRGRTRFEVVDMDGHRIDKLLVTITTA